jgi:hypothetical protein
MPNVARSNLCSTCTAKLLTAQGLQEVYVRGTGYITGTPEVNFPMADNPLVGHVGSYVRRSWSRLGFQSRQPLHRASPRTLLQPTADGGLVARILFVEVALEKPLFSSDHNHRDEADSWNERCEQPQVIQPN